MTVWWSIVADRSWDAFNKGVAYVAFLGLGFVLAALGRASAARLAAGMLSIVIGTTLTWALVTKAVPSLAEDERVARLNEPVDHWNALALLADVGDRPRALARDHDAHRRRPLRVAGALLVYVATLALMLTLSRAGVVVAVGVVALWLALTSERVQSGLVLVAAAGPALVVAGWAFTRSGLTEDLAPHADRVSDGRILGVLALVGAVVVGVLVSVGLGRSLADERRRRVGRLLIAAAAVLIVAAAIGASVAAADAVSSGRKCAEVVNDPSRFGSLDVSNRLCWWEEAWDVFQAHDPEGAGAGTFEIARKRFRPNADTVLQPHSVPLQQLADGGVVAFGLFLLVLLAGAAVCVCAVRRLPGNERTAAVALVAAPTAYLAHALVDYNWDFLAVTAPTMVALGALAGSGRATTALRKRPDPRHRDGPARRGRPRLVLLPAPRRSGGATVDEGARRRRSHEGARRGALGALLQSGLGRSALRARTRRGARGRRLACRALLHQGGRAPAGQPAHLVHARRLRVRRAQRTCAPPTASSTTRTRSTRRATSGRRADRSTSPATRSTRAAARRGPRDYGPRMKTTCARPSSCGRIPSSGVTSFTPRSLPSRLPSPANPGLYMTMLRGTSSAAFVTSLIL